MSAQKEPQTPFASAPIQTVADASASAANGQPPEISAPAGRTDAAEFDAIRRAHPEAETCDNDVLRQVMEKVDSQLATLDERVRDHVSAHVRPNMISAGIKAANRAAHGGGRQKLGQAIESAIAPQMQIARGEAMQEVREIETKASRPKQKSGIVAAAEEVVQPEAQSPLAEMDLSRVPPETVVEMRDSSGTVFKITVGTLLAAGALGMAMKTTRNGFDFSQMTIVDASLKDLEKIYDQNIDPMHHQKMVDERKAESEQKKKEAEQAIAAKQSAETAQGHAGKIKEDRALANLIPNETLVD